MASEKRPQSLADFASKRIAPWHQVPDVQVVSVEHPFIVKDIEKGLRTLGGDRSIAKLLNSKKNEPFVPLFTRPEDPTSIPLLSQLTNTNNILLKITVPRRTGRKRKRGSSELYREADAKNGVQALGEGGKATTDTLSRAVSTEYLLRSLRDNVTNYTIEPIGLIEKTYRFRGLSDFQHATTDGTFMNKVKDTILDYDYEKMKGFKFDDGRGVKVNTELIPPPITGRLPHPFNYSYLQNPAVKIRVDASGVPTLTNTQAPQRVLTHMITHDAASVPTAPPSQLPALESLDLRCQRAVYQLRGLLEERPIWTRRALTNQVIYAEGVLKYAWQYAGYMFRSGPWREALVRFGLDPRVDPQYRIYQTFMFQISIEERKSNKTKWVEERTKYRRVMKGKKRDDQSHIFDGRKISLDGKTWQVCDVTDPLLRRLLATDNLRTTCETRCDGWYHNGLWAKIKTIFKEKARCLLSGKEVPSDVDFRRIVDLPDIIDERTRQQALLPREASSWEVELASEIRTRAALTHPSRKGMRDRRAKEMETLGIVDKGDAKVSDNEDEEEGEEVEDNDQEDEEDDNEEDEDEDEE